MEHEVLGFGACSCFGLSTYMRAYVHHVCK